MVEDDTVKLLRECNAGIKMGTSSIDEVMPAVKSEKLRTLLNACKDRHATLGNETRELLNAYHDEGKEPNMMAKSMSWLKTNMKLAVDASDAAIADLMTDGCNMGVKSLNRYLNQYGAASEKAKDIAKRLIDLEHQLTIDMRCYL